MNFIKPPVSVCCQILRKASDHTIVLTEKLLNYFLKSKFGSFCALSYVEKCGQSEKVVHTKERGRGGVQYQHQQLFFTNTKKTQRQMQTQRQNTEEWNTISTTTSFFANTNTETKATTKNKQLQIQS